MDRMDTACVVLERVMKVRYYRVETEPGYTPDMGNGAVDVTEEVHRAIEMLGCPMVYQKCDDREGRGEPRCMWCQARIPLE